MPNGTQVTTNGTVVGTLMTILKTHGPWAFYATIFLVIIIVLILVPFYESQKAIAKDRECLMTAVQKSLEQNSASMEKMSSAIERLDETMASIKTTEVETTDLLEGFTAEVKTIHKVQCDKLDKIDKQTAPP